MDRNKSRSTGYVRQGRIIRLQLLPSDPMIDMKTLALVPTPWRADISKGTIDAIERYRLAGQRPPS